MISYGALTKNLYNAYQILAVKWVEGGCFSEVVKKGKFVTKIFLSDNVE